MRMTKALIAAICLALVLVAAVVVPLVVLPGTFGFDEWPQATRSAAREQVVTLEVPAEQGFRTERAPRPVAVTRPDPAPAPAAHRQLAQAAPAPVAAAPVPTTPTAPSVPQQQAPAAGPQAAPEAQPAPPVAQTLGDAPVIAATSAADGTNLR
jgi:hypothetical protein